MITVVSELLRRGCCSLHVQQDTACCARRQATFTLACWKRQSKAQTQTQTERSGTQTETGVVTAHRVLAAAPTHARTHTMGHTTLSSSQHVSACAECLLRYRSLARRSSFAVSSSACKSLVVPPLSAAAGMTDDRQTPRLTRPTDQHSAACTPRLDSDSKAHIPLSHFPAPHSLFLYLSLCLHSISELRLLLLSVASSPSMSPHCLPQLNMRALIVAS